MKKNVIRIEVKDNLEEMIKNFVYQAVFNDAELAIKIGTSTPVGVEIYVKTVKSSDNKYKMFLEFKGFTTYWRELDNITKENNRFSIPIEDTYTQEDFEKLFNDESFKYRIRNCLFTLTNIDDLEIKF